MQSTLVLLALSLNLVLFIADPNAADGACPSPEHPDWTTECPDGKWGPPGWLCCPSFKKRSPPGFVFGCLNSVNCHKTEADANKACDGAYEICAPGRESGSVGSPPAT